MATISCHATLCTMGAWTLLRLPTGASARLPSRGMAMVEGTINGSPFQAPLEPDGKGSHWLRVDDALCAVAGADAGDTVTLVMEPVTDWPAPAVPADVQAALVSIPQAHALWMTSTPKAQWDWIRWIRATTNPDTRRRRIEVACSKLQAGAATPLLFQP